MSCTPRHSPHAERRLHREFTILFDANMIHHFLYDSYQEIGSRASVNLYLPLLAERFARQRPHARYPASIRRRHTRPKPHATRTAPQHISPPYTQRMDALLTVIGIGALLAVTGAAYMAFLVLRGRK
ncbi:three-helix bundle dimerization domain-containing protein [Nocardia sp. CA-107356]|uniref:three-helix bundle dimerization domain-containing protein n=1 Tax=Nocardia sp. CA-107356 TaxID=3239972 RepID=UPI003D8E23BF